MRPVVLFAAAVNVGMFSCLEDAITGQDVALIALHGAAATTLVTQTSYSAEAVQEMRLQVSSVEGGAAVVASAQAHYYCTHRAVLARCGCSKVATD